MEEAGSQTLRAALALRELILDGELPAGVRVAEIPLSERIGVSRTPLRLALARLEHEGCSPRCRPAASSCGVHARGGRRRDQARGVLEGTRRASRRAPAGPRRRRALAAAAEAMDRDCASRRRRASSTTCRSTSVHACSSRWAQRRRRAGRRARDAAAVRLAGVRAGQGDLPSPSRSCCRRSSSTTRSSTRFALVRARAPRTRARALRLALRNLEIALASGRRASACRRRAHPD